MRNINLLLDKNRTNSTNVKVDKGTVVIRTQDKLFSGETISFIIAKINAVHKRYPKVRMPIEFYFGKITFIDKLTFVILECICYDLICNYGHYVQIFMEVDVSNDIHIAGITSSPLLLLNDTAKATVRKYPTKFKKDLYGSHFRRLIAGEEKEETNYLGIVYQEIDSFLKPFGVEEISRDKVSNVISELVGNACEHGETDCLVDIDVATKYTKIIKNRPDGYNYYGINIAVVNMSNILLGSGIYNNIIKSNLNDTNERYETVLRAYDNHKKYFSDVYTIDDFCNITAFQHKISGREQFSDTGGTGLTKLIKSLEERSDTYRCYVISGRRAINFYKELLEYNDNQWIGFNKEKNYISNIPSMDENGKEVVTNSLIYMPGTGYNLNFVMKGDKINEE